MLQYVIILCCIAQVRSQKTTVLCAKQIHSESCLPWHVTVECKNSNIESPDCGGTLLNSFYVVTAAHCLYDLTGNSIKQSDLRILFYRRGVIEKISVVGAYHPDEFHVNSFEADVGLLKLKFPVVFDGDVSAICWTLTNSTAPRTNIRIPLPNRSDGNLVNVVKWEVTNQEVCHGTNQYIFGASSNQSFCMGSLKSTDRFQVNRGSGLLIIQDNSWILIGILLYTVGPMENISTYGGGVDLLPYMNWINETIIRTAKQRVVSEISNKMCDHYNAIAVKPDTAIQFYPTIDFLSNEYNVLTGCQGSLISERFILTAAICIGSLGSIRMQNKIGSAFYYQNLKLHLHPEDSNRQGIALIELDRNASNLEYFIHCLWTDDENNLQFETELQPKMNSYSSSKIKVSYNPNEPVRISFDQSCSRFTAALVYKMGNVLTFRKDNERVKRILGLINTQIESCKPTTVLNVNSYLQWIEGVVWDSNTAEHMQTVY